MAYAGIDSVIINFSPIISNHTIQNTSCFGSCDGKANITVDNAHLPVTYIWSNGVDSSYINSYVLAHIMLLLQMLQAALNMIHY